MNCDQVFDILTRGPFPSGETTDGPVELHLACCHECRQLAEALRPAVELLHESIGPEEGAELPGYRGSLRGLAPAAHPVAVDELMRLEAGGGRRGLASPATQSWTAGVVWFRVAATLLLGVGAGFLVHAFLQADGADRGEANEVAGAGADRSVPLANSLPTLNGERLLQKLAIPNVCRLLGASSDDENEYRPATVSAELSRFTTASGFICCKQCHAGEQLAERPAAREMVGQQCLVCHR